MLDAEPLFSANSAVQTLAYRKLDRNQKQRKAESRILIAEWQQYSIFELSCIHLSGCGVSPTASGRRSTLQLSPGRYARLDGGLRLLASDNNGKWARSTAVST